MCFDSILMEGEMAISSIAKILLTSEAFYHRLYEVSKIAGNMLCAAVEISSMILLCMGDCWKVTLIALVCVVTVINFAEMVIVSLKIGRSPKVKKSCDIAVRVCFVIHKIFTIAVIFLGVMENDDCGNNVSDSWLLKVMIAFTVWDFLLIIWVVMLSTERTDHLQTNERNKRLRRWKSLRVAEMINITVSVILIAGSISFPVAVIVALFTCRKN
ncbi:uncharacterized protein LOC115779496 [Archocentrus centrarchus]|uniref:uncharacterized protein LOC115779496 n=1 Tax=Archocentrus centrarchus TaxID=63155 RepID=UPI0011EA383A|nr:uncharacterized protein LOC115779496 [Archocentrus centrarchus]